jgi:hypothetical protein
MSDQSISRRRFLGAAAGAAGAAAVGSWAAPKAFSSSPDAIHHKLQPKDRLGVQQFSVRDAVTRRSIANSRANGLTPTMGYLGGPTFPDDPTDLGPLVPLPGGFIEVFEFLASVGYNGFEFFQFSQNVNELGRQPTVAEIRTYLDNAGLGAQGTHTAGLGTMYSATTGGLSPAGQTQIDNAHILGMPMVGTAGDPTNSSVLATVGTTIGWEEAARRANLIGEVLRGEGLVWYWHVEQNGFQGFNATVHPELVGKNRMTWFFEHTTPDAVMNESDVFHAYAGRARFPFPGWTAADPYNPAFLWDAWGWWQENHARVVGWHIKDGTRLATQPLPPGNPFTQTVTRPPTFAPGGLANNDALYTGEGSIGQGYPVDPDPGMVGFDQLFHKTKKVEKGAPRFFIAESDNAIGPASDPGRSLRHAKLAAEYLLGKKAPSWKAKSHDDDHGKSESELEAELAG